MEAKNAVKTAILYVQDIFEGQLLSEPIVEEVWPNKRETVWNVTLSLQFISSHSTRPLSEILGQLPKKKVVSISAENGKPISVRDWPFSDAA
jgi:hypothetical protein